MAGAGKLSDEAALPGAAEQQPASGHAFSASICVPLRFQTWFKFKSNCTQIKSDASHTQISADQVKPESWF
jgi:hypothetical protein